MHPITVASADLAKGSKTSSTSVSDVSGVSLSRFLMMRAQSGSRLARGCFVAVFVIGVAVVAAAGAGDSGCYCCCFAGETAGV